MGIGALEGIEGVIHDSLCKEASMEVHENWERGNERMRFRERRRRCVPVSLI